ncbi:alpha/beta hydrolase [Streptomyces sp. NPDC093970]|uniref:alpha/beta fold hydrolase n=1 Tax=Streptomyces sp. NPDC093970 TaxID=3155076 RepID=UPI0034128D23
MNTTNHTPGRGTLAPEAAGRARTVVVDGTRQVYRVTGRGPVCLVHPGGPGAHSAYLRLPGLRDALTLVYLDPVGSGASDPLPDGDYSMSRYARFAEAVLDDLGAASGYFLGHSHGGFVALQFALDRPGRLDGLILYDTAPVAGTMLTAAAAEEMTALVRRRPDDPEVAEAARTWHSAHVTRTLKITDDASHRRYLDRVLPAYFADHRGTTGREGGFSLSVTHDPNRLPADWDVRDRLGTIDVPTLVVVGAHDVVCPPRFAHALHSALPRARLCELRDSGHFGHIEEPDAFVAAVLDFVRDQERKQGNDQERGDRA